MGNADSAGDVACDDGWMDVIMLMLMMALIMLMLMLLIRAPASCLQQQADMPAEAVSRLPLLLLLFDDG